VDIIIIRVMCSCGTCKGCLTAYQELLNIARWPE